ncbi:uncharacterized protein ACRADG_006752 isoform 2-T2 [Cochliomyia hominivorax]
MPQIPRKLVYYDKNQLKVGEGGAGNAKSGTNPPATNAYRLPYSQVPQHQQYQQQQQQQQHHTKNHLRAAIKNVAIQQQQLPYNQPNILYAAPPNAAYHYERIPQQPQQQIQIPVVPPVPAQRGQQKSIQYVIAIPLSYLRQFQQQILHQQQQEQLQVFKGQQQPQQQQQLQPLPVYSIAGPLARDNHGAYRPFHRFAPTAVNDVSSGTPQQQQTVSVAAASQHLLPASAASPGYVTQYIQIPASVLLAAAQSAQVQLQQQQRPIHLPQNLYQQQPQIQLQQPIHQHQQQQQQHAQTLAPQLYYYQPQQQFQLQHQQQQQQQVQLKQSQPSPLLTSPPVYVHPIQQQLQQPTQQHQTFQHLAEQQQQQQQQINVGKQQHSHRVRGVRPTVTFTPSQYDSSVTAYESEEKAQLVALQAPAHTNLKAHTHTNAHSQQYIAQAPLAPAQQHQLHQHQPTATAHQLVQAKAPEVYEHIIPYSPQYIEQYQVQQQHQQPQQQPRHHQAHRLQIQPQQHNQLVDHLNNLQISQGTHGPTPLPFLRLHTPAATGVTPIYNLNTVTTPAIQQPFFSGTYQPAFTPLGEPSKVTSFTNVLLQPFVGHSSSFASPEIGTAVADSLPFIHHTGGVRYATHLYHPPTSAATLVAGNNKQHNSVGAQAHPSPRILNTAGEGKVSAASSAKVTSTVSASPTIVKYP